jgi:hypothetical protein
MARPHRIDPTRSQIRIQTRAKGMLARLAHDLEIVSAAVEGRAMIDEAAWSADLSVPVASLRVAGTLRGERLDASALSAADRAEIERKLRDEVFPRAAKITVSARGETRDRAEVQITWPGGSTRTTAKLKPSSRAADAPAGGAPAALTIAGRCEISLAALGVAEVKAPLGAFKVADAVVVYAELTLLPEAAG